MEFAPGVTAEVFGRVPSAGAPGWTVYLARFTFQPGTENFTHNPPGTTLLGVKSGSLGWTIAAGADSVVRGAAAGASGPAEDQTEPGTNVLLEPGGAIFYDADVIHTARGAGDGLWRRRRPACRPRWLVLDAGQALLMPTDMEMGAILIRSNARRLVREWVKKQDARQSTTPERDRLNRKAVRIRTLYLEGDLDDADYRHQRADAAAALAAIPPDPVPTSEAVGKQLAALLADLSKTWAVTTPEERNQLARHLFADVVVDNRTAVAVSPRPELGSFFESLAVNPDTDVTLKT